MDDAVFRAGVQVGGLGHVDLVFLISEQSGVGPWELERSAIGRALSHRSSQCSERRPVVLLFIVVVSSRLCVEWKSNHRSVGGGQNRQLQTVGALRQ